jgi:calcium-dependent protein kinase
LDPRSDRVRKSKLITVGAFGEVRKCINRKTAVTRAVKIIKKDSLDPKEKVRFF